MRFSDLNINLNQQACSHAFQATLESLRSWGCRLFQALQNHPYALHNNSPQVISGVLLTINGLFFLAMRSFANAIEASLNKRFPNIPTIHLMISSAVFGGTVGALNLALFKLARLPVSVVLLYAISIASVALHLILKPPTSSGAIRIPLPSQPLPRPIAHQPSELQSKTTLHTQWSPPLPPISHSPPHQPESPENEQPSKPFLPRPPARASSTDFLTPMPSKPHVNQPHTPTFTPINQATPPGTPATVPQLNVKDVEDVETKVLEEINQLELKKDKINTLLKRYETLIQQFKTEMQSAYKKRSGSTASLISHKLQESEQGQQQALSCIQNLDRELAKQRKLLEDIREKKLGAVSSEHPSAFGTPEAKFRQQLVKAASSLSLRVQEPPALKARADFLEFNQSLNSPEREEAPTTPLLELPEDRSQPASTATDFPETQQTCPDDQLPLNFSSEDEQLDDWSDSDDDDYDYEDEEGNLYRQLKFSDGNCYVVSQNGDCFDLNGNYVGSLIEKAFK